MFNRTDDSGEFEVTAMVLATFAFVALIALLVVLGWQLHWWLAKSNQNHQNQINRGSYSFQTAQLDDMEKVYTNISGLDVQIKQQPQNADALGSQRIALVNRFCYDRGTITNISVPSYLQSFAQENCPS
jgi:hypothetical protein